MRRRTCTTEVYAMVISSPFLISNLASKATCWLCIMTLLAFGEQECETMLKMGKIAMPSLSRQESELVQSKPTARSYSSSVKSNWHFFKYSLTYFFWLFHKSVYFFRSSLWSINGMVVLNLSLCLLSKSLKGVMHRYWSMHWMPAWAVSGCLARIAHSRWCVLPLSHFGPQSGHLQRVQR